MGLSEGDKYSSQEINISEITTAKKRRLRRKKLKAARTSSIENTLENSKLDNTINITASNNTESKSQKPSQVNCLCLNTQLTKDILNKFKNIAIDQDIDTTKMSSKESAEKPRDEVLAAREAKKLAKLKGKKKEANSTQDKTSDTPIIQTNIVANSNDKESSQRVNANNNETLKSDQNVSPDKNKNISKSTDEVDKAVVKLESVNIEETSKELIKAERAAKKAAKQAKKKGTAESADAAASDMTVKEVVDTLKDIVTVAKEFQAVTDKVKAMDLGGKKSEESTKSKAELKAERRAKQEAQRAAKQATQQKQEAKLEPSKEPVKAKEKSPKPKPVEKPKTKAQSVQKMDWFQHLYTENDKESLNQMEINSNLHPAVIKLGVQLSSHVVAGSNARCIAFLDALKKMIRDYSLPARTEFGRGLEAQLAGSVAHLRARRAAAASQHSALQHLRHQLAQLPNNVDEFDAKKRLQEEIDRYIREQIDMAGEAISIAVRNKISDGDNILTYGCSSLIERILCDAHAAGVRFRAVVVGARVQAGGAGGREMLRRLLARGVPCTYADISALSHLMKNVNKVLLGASALLANGSVLGALGTMQVALVARAFNVPLLVACETHKVSDRVQTDAFVYNEIGDPDDLIDKSDENSPLKDWRSNPNLTLLNLTYDVTPASLVTAVVTELAILPCTSAPVVLRFKLSEYGL